MPLSFPFQFQFHFSYYLDMTLDVAEVVVNGPNNEITIPFTPLAYYSVLTFCEDSL